MNKIRAVIIGVCAAVAVLVIAFFGVNATINNPQRLLSLGERYLLEMDYEQAVVYFERVIKIEPKNVRAYLGAAEAYVALAQTDKAIETLRLGLERTNDPAIESYLATLEAHTPSENNDNGQSIVQTADGSTELPTSNKAANSQNGGLMQSGDNFTVFDADDFVAAWNIIADIPQTDSGFVISLQNDITLAENLKRQVNGIVVTGKQITISGNVTIGGEYIQGLQTSASLMLYTKIIIPQDADLTILNMNNIFTFGVENYGQFILMAYWVTNSGTFDNYGDFSAYREQIVDGGGGGAAYFNTYSGLSNEGTINNYATGRITGFDGHADGQTGITNNEGVISFDASRYNFICVVEGRGSDFPAELFESVKYFYHDGWNGSDYAISYNPNFGGRYEGNGKIRLYNARTAQQLLERGFDLSQITESVEWSYYTQNEYTHYYVADDFYNYDITTEYMEGLIGLTFNGIDEYQEWLKVFSEFEPKPMEVAQ